AAHAAACRSRRLNCRASRKSQIFVQRRCPSGSRRGPLASLGISRQVTHSGSGCAEGSPTHLTTTSLCEPSASPSMLHPLILVRSDRDMVLCTDLVLAALLVVRSC